MKSQRGFTLVEVLIYAATLSITAGLLTAILSNTVRVRTKEANSTELSQQLNFTLDTIHSLVNESALIDDVYEGTSTSTACSQYCTLKLRMTASSTDPTYISSNSSGIYLTQGQSATTTLTGAGVTVDRFLLTKYEFEGGHASVKVDIAMTIGASNPQFAVTRSIQSAIGRVTAAVFDDHLLPNADNSFDVGQVTGSKRWKDGAFSGNVTVGGNVGIGVTSPGAKLDVNGLIIGGFGAYATSGTLDWNDSTNARPGSGYSLLLGTATNGPGPAGYYHPFSFEYGTTKTGSGNLTQFAIPYASGSGLDAGLYFRGRYSAAWGSWRKILSENSSGHVSVGTTTPMTRLHVQYGKAGLNDAAVLVNSSNCGTPCGQEDWNEGLRVQNDNTNGRVGIGFLATSTPTINTVPNVWMGTINNSAGGAARTFVIATNPSGSLVQQLQIDGDDGDLWVKKDILAEGKIIPKSAGAGEYIANGQNTGTGDWGLDFYTGNASRLYIKNSGSVGVGTTTPGYKLHVTGDIYANGGWVRVSGTNGLYFESYGGGWQMTDANWIRAYGSKAVYISGFYNYNVGVTFGGHTGTAVYQTFGAQALDMSILTDKAGMFANMYTRSDRRMKKDIQSITDEEADEFLEITKPVMFKWKDSGTPDSGFIAQDLIKVGLGQLVTTAPAPDLEETIDEDGLVSPAGTQLLVKYDAVVPILTAIAQRQDKKIKVLEGQVVILANELEKITGEEINIEDVDPVSSKDNKTETIFGIGLLGGILGAAIISLLPKRKR